MTLIFITLIAVLLLWGISLQGKTKKLQAQLMPIKSIDIYVESVRKTADDRLARAREEAARLVEAAKQESSNLEQRIRALKSQAQTAKNELDIISENLRLSADDAYLLEVGYYQPVYGFEGIAEYEKEIKKIKEDQRNMLRSLSGKEFIPDPDTLDPDKIPAAWANSSFTYNGSAAQGEKLLLKVLKLMLRAFNGECDAFIARVNYRNVGAMEKRIESACAQINKIGSTWDCMIFTGYVDSRIKELRLAYEYTELQERIKREQAAIREQMREEERSAREAEKAQKQIEDERKKLEEQLASEKDKAKIAELQKIIEGLNSRSRAISQAQITRAGNVYILSNVGSFGDNVFKIGMTRREVPEDRVKELGDASVPFPFDVHAMISTKDAPSLERALHNHFDRRRLNLENERKEFFRLTIEEIRDELERLKDDLGIEAEIRISLLAEAKEYRMSEAKRKHLQGSDG